MSSSGFCAAGHILLIMPVPDTLAQPGQAVIQNPYGQRIRFGQNLLAPASAIYMGPSDFLLVQILSPTTTTTMSLSWSLLKFDGTVEYNTINGAVAALATFQNFSATAAEGFLLSYLLTTNNTNRGQCYSKVFINSAAGAWMQLGASYTSLTYRQAYPFPLNENSLAGPGSTRLVNTPDVTGGNPSWTVPAAAYWKVRSIRSQFTASAAGAARSIDAQVQPSGGSIGVQAGAAATIAPSGSQVLNWAQGLNNASIGLFQTMGFPGEFLIPPASVVTLVASVLDVGDKFQGNNIYVEEFAGQ